jgi:CD109 antigen
VTKLASNATKYGIKLNLNMKKFSIFIQTDKGIYKAGDKVLFRVIVTDGNTKPFAVQSMRIFITDGAGNRVKQYRKPVIKSGVTRQAFQLSDEVVLGTWSISVNVNNSTSEEIAYFEVAEYVLPNFEVNVITKSDISKNDDLIVSYSAVYTFGTDVEGQAVVRVERPSWWWENTVIYEKTLTDSKTVVINLKNDLAFDTMQYDEYIKVSVIFTETLTGKQEIVSKDVIIHYNAFLIDFSGNDYFIKPGLPFDLTMYVKDYNGVPVTDLITAATVNITYVYDVLVTSTTTTTSSTTDFWWWVPPQYVEETVTLSRFVKNGTATMPLKYNLNITTLRVSAAYKDSFGYYYGYYLHTTANQYLDVKIDSRTSTSVTIEVTCNVKMQYFFYMVVARGSIVSGSRVPVSNLTTTKFTFNLLYEMKPAAYIIVFYMTPAGDIISDRVELSFDYEFANFVRFLIIQLGFIL